MLWGLVGASTIAAEHMIAAIRSQGGEAGWIVSGVANHAKAYAQANGIIQSTSNIDEMLADPKVAAVYISSTNEKHMAQALAAIAAGKHVLCEKPLAMKASDARMMVEAAANQGVVFGTNHHLRNAGSHMKMRELILGGRIGKVLSVRVHHAVFLPSHLQGWRINDAGAGGGVIADITVHDADTVRFLLGEDPVDVVAMATSSGMGAGVEDSCMSLWSVPSGAQIMAHESFTHGFAGTGIEVHGTEGSLFGRGIMTQQPVGEIELVTNAGREAITYSKHNLYGQSVKRFVEAVQGTGTPAADGWDGVKSLAVAEAVKQAAQSGSRVTIKYGA